MCRLAAEWGGMLLLSEEGGMLLSGMLLLSEEGGWMLLGAAAE